MAHVDYSNQKDLFVKEIEYCKSLRVGDKIKFISEKQRYTIKAKSDRFLICTKPFNPKKTVLYTIVDLERLVRGRDNLVFTHYDYRNQDGIDRCLKDLVDRTEFPISRSCVEVSHRNCIKLDVEIQ